MQGNSRRYTRHDRDLAATLEDILALMQRLHAESIDIFSKLTDDNLRRDCRNIGGVDIPGSQWLRSMTKYEIHHRGQLYIYPGILGVPTPPLYGLTSEEVRARGTAS
jgi:uncharacterized damage-inducible protein DinB